MANFSHFHLTLLVFVLSILLLIISPNFFSIILGWDGLGVSSYLLVIFYKRTKSLNAGLLTGIRNRVGDGLILLRVAGISMYPYVNLPCIGLGNSRIRSLVLVMLGIAAITKRAQLPFSAWLPAAIAAPTPVSALVHSSTLVTAGIYLMIRLSNSLPARATFFLSFVGVITILLARIRALKESDGKKIVALSTLSQLGVMFTGFRFNLSSLVFFHLLTHAFFKALLFIRTGYLIHNFNNYQNLRLIGGGIKFTVYNNAIVTITKLSLAGLPFFSAFYSKESLLETLGAGHHGFLLVYLGILLGVCLTVLYSVRFVFLSAHFYKRGEVAMFSRIKASAIYFRSLILITPRVSAGKWLFPHIISFRRTPLVRAGAKVITIRVLLLRTLAYYLQNKLGSGLFKFFRGIWGLPVFIGVIPLKALKSSGLETNKLIIFSIIDFLLINWAKKLSAFTSSQFLQSSSSITRLLIQLVGFYLVIYFVLLI